MSPVSVSAARILWLLSVVCPLSLPFLSVAAAERAPDASMQNSFAGSAPLIEILRPPSAQVRSAREGPDLCESKDRQADPGLAEERRAVFDFDAPDAGGLFAESRWILLPDRFGFLPSPTFLNASVPTCSSGRAVSVPLMRTKTFTLVGRLSPVGSDGRTLELHGVHEGPTGSIFTIDGYIRNGTGVPVLDAVYSVGLPGSQQIGHVRLRLEPRTADEAPSDTAAPAAPFTLPDLGPPGDPARPPEAHNRALAEQRARQEEMLSSGGGEAYFHSLVETYQFKDETIGLDPVLFTVDEPKLVEGIPVMSRFDIHLTGTVDGIEFGPLPGMLMFAESERPGQRVSVLLSADGFSDETPGTIIADTDTGSAWEVRAADGTLNLALLDHLAGPASSMLWTTTLNGAPTGALPSRVEGTLSIDNDRVRGSLEGEGYIGVDGSRSSRYSARISGVLHEHRLFKEVLARVGVLPLTGDWDSGSEELGVIRIRDAGAARTGTFGSDGTGNFDGGIAHGVLSLASTGDADSRAWGFLRPLPGGDQAIGLWSTASDRSDATAILATQPRETWNGGAAGLTDEEIELLHKLGRDLAGQGRYTQALSVLDLVWSGYDARLEEEKSSRSPEHEIFGVLVQMHSISTPMIESAFALGRFETTLEQLRKALFLQRELNPLTRAQHAFESKAAHTGKEIRRMATTVSVLIEHLESLHSPKVGIMLNPRAAGQPLIIGGIGSGGPAARAELVPGEEIISIDDELARPLETEDALRALGGAEGTPLKLVVDDGNEQREVVVVRGSWNSSVRSPERRVALEKGLDSLRSSAEESRSALLALAEAVEQVEVPAEPSKEAFDAAYQGVLDLVEAERSRVPERVRHLTTLGESLFGDWDRYMPTQRFVLHALGQMIGEPGQVPLAERPHSIEPGSPIGVVEDEMVNALFADPAISGPEASLFFEHFKAAAITLGLSGELREARRGMKLWSQLAQPTAAAMAAHARQTAKFSQWLERWRARMALDQTKIAALDAAAIFAREWLAFLWELEPKTDGVSRGGAVEVLLAAEAVRNRAMQDLLAARRDTRRGQYHVAETARLSFEAQAPPKVEELVALVHARGGTTVVYQSLDERLLVWVLDAAEFSCALEEESSADERTATNDSYNEVLHQMRTVADAWYPQKDSEGGRYRCHGIEARQLDVSADDIQIYATVFQHFASRQRISSKDGSAQTFVHWLHHLYHRLVEPVAHLLPADPDAVVTIVPDAELFQIPFGAMVSTPIKDDLQGLRYLVEDHPIVYLTSVGMMRFTQKNARRAAEAAASELVTFWDPLGIEYSGLEPFFKNEEIRPRVEAHLTAHYPQDAPRSLFSGTGATTENLFATASRARVLTLVTHAKASEEPGDEQGAYIALAGAPLPLTDIYKLDLHADLAILAGCVTGRGRIGSDGVIGLSRAFVFAGAPTLAMTLWDVPVGDTLLLLDRFYRAYLNEGKTEAQALRQAQIDTIAEVRRRTKEPQPHIWAGMVLFGEP